MRNFTLRRVLQQGTAVFGLTLVSLSLTSLGIAGDSLTSVQAQTTRRSPKVTFVPPPMKFNRGAPGNRGHNASRGTSCQDTDTDAFPLTTFVPVYQKTKGEHKMKYVASMTASPQPILWAYVPVDETAISASLEWILQDEAGKEIYQTPLTVPQESSLIRIAPPNMPELEAGSYEWLLFYQVLCSEGDTELMEDYDSGIVEYKPNPTIRGDETARESAEVMVEEGASGEALEIALEQMASRLEQAAIAAEAGYWHEAFDSVALLKKSFPQDQAVDAAWQSLLSSIALEAFAEVPFSGVRPPLKVE